MPTISEGRLTFQFPAEWKATKYDDWSFYRNRFQSVCAGAKAVDMLVISADKHVWLVEVKDYRIHPRTKTEDLADEVAYKVRDTLAALFCARLNADDPAEREFAGRALRSKSLGVVLHLEQPAKRSKLFPRAIDPADIKQKLKQLLKAVDAHPRVVETERMMGTPWTVAQS